MILLLLLLNIVASQSAYSGPGTDTIVHDGADAFEILGTVEKPSKLKHIKGLKLTKNEIPDESYPYWGHGGDAIYQDDFCTEAAEIVKRFNNIVEATVDDMYYHPAGIKQFNGNETMIAKADRMKVKMVMNNLYSDFHLTPFYIPPGEIITIEYVTNMARNSVTLTINSQSPDFPKGCPVNLKYPRIEKIQSRRTLSKKVNKIVWPYGGLITFGWGNGGDSYPELHYPIEIVVSGVVLSTLFVYGVNEDKDMATQLTERAGPFICYDSGNVFGLGPSDRLKNNIPTRPSDALRLVRTWWQISQETARDHHMHENSMFGRCRHPNRWNYDSFMHEGAWAFAVGSQNFCQYPIEAVASPLNYLGMMKGSWGELHEMNHHRQQNWGIGYTLEVTNNVINLICYSLALDPITRIDHGNGNMGTGGRTGEGHSHPLFALWGEYDNNLSFWHLMMHFFGVKTFQEFVRSDQGDTLYKKQKYGYVGAEVLRASKIFGRNMIHHFNFHGYSNETIGEKAIKELNEMNLPFFHPITNFYTSGYVVDGEEFETVNPFVVASYFKSIMTIKKCVKTREEYVYQESDPSKKGGKELWGHFELVRLEGRAGGWKEISDGIYEYTPLNDIFAVDKFYLIYKDTTTNEEQKLVGSIKQNPNLMQTIRYEEVADEEGNKFTDVTKAYESAIKKEPALKSSTSSFNTGNYDSGTSPYISIVRGTMRVPYTENYTFYLRDDDMGMLYISENELKLDPNQDQDYLLISSNKGIKSYSEDFKSEALSMSTDKLYHFAIICYNVAGSGFASAGVKYGSATKASNIPDSWISGKHILTEEDMIKLENVPKWHDIPGMNEWRGMTAMDIDGSNFIVTAPRGENEWDNPLVIFDPVVIGQFVYTVEWDTDSPPPFPHNYDIDCLQEISFEYMILNTYKDDTINLMDSDIEIYIAPSADKLNDPEFLVYKGNYKSASPKIPNNETFIGRFIRISFLNNKVIWETDYGIKRPGQSNIAYLQMGTKLSKNYKYIIPSTSTKIVAPSSTLSTASIGFNGKVRIVPNKETMLCTFPKGTKEFMVIGDKYKGMGSATFYINDKKVGEIDKTIYFYDYTSLIYSSRSYRSCLFQSGKLDENVENVLKMVVTEGDIALAGFVSNVENIIDNDSSSSQKSNNKNKKTSVIVGSVVGIVIVAAVIVGVVIYFIKYKGINPFGDIFKPKETDTEKQRVSLFNLNV